MKSKKRILIISLILVLLLGGWVALTKVGIIPNCLNIEFLCPKQNIEPKFEPQPYNNDYLPAPKKPVIYFYPQQIEDVSVQLNYHGAITASYPQYNEATKGWNVVAFPDGKLMNHADNKTYSYLFWEGLGSEQINWDFSKGFVVKGSDTREFLQTTLAKMGLTPKEYNEFIVYWYPRMQGNAYNLITFAGTQYTDTAPLAITPAPDSMLRVFMVFKPLEKPATVAPQTIKPFERHGFTVVEWGGTEAN